MSIQCNITPVLPGQARQGPLEKYKSDEMQDVTATPGARYSRYINVDGLEEMNFAITVTVSQEYAWEAPYLGVYMFVDGVSLLTHAHKLSKLYPALRITDHTSKKPDNDNVIYKSPLKFGKLEIVDDDTALGQHISEEEVKKLGVILVQIYRGTDSPPKPEKPEKAAKAATPKSSKKTPPDSSSLGILVQSLTKVPEKKLKGQDISYGVQFGPARAIELAPPKRSSSSPGWMLIDNKKSPFMSFEYLYRSRKALQSLGVLPREEAPRRELKPIPVAEMSPCIRIGSPNISSARTKNERDVKTPSQSSQAEPDTPRAKKRKIEPTGIDLIDLTELD